MGGPLRMVSRFTQQRAQRGRAALGDMPVRVAVHRLNGYPQAVNEQVYVRARDERGELLQEFERGEEEGLGAVVPRARERADLSVGEDLETFLPERWLRRWASDQLR